MEQNSLIRRRFSFSHTAVRWRRRALKTPRGAMSEGPEPSRAWKSEVKTENESELRQIFIQYSLKGSTNSTHTLMDVDTHTGQENKTVFLCVCVHKVHFKIPSNFYFTVFPFLATWTNCVFMGNIVLFTIFCSFQAIVPCYLRINIYRTWSFVNRDAPTLLS